MPDQPDDQFPAPLPSADDQPTQGDRGDGGRFAQGNQFRFPPGKSGNPGGRKPAFWTLLEKLAWEVVEKDPKQRTALELAFRAQFGTAFKGGSAGVQALEKILDRLYGRVPIRLKPELDEDGEVSMTDLRIRVYRGGPISKKPDGEKLPE